MAIHCGINLYTLERLERQNYRYGGLVSKGGTSLVAWMRANNRENPLYEKFDRVVNILKKYDVVLSLGNGLRSGAIADSFDRAMVQELIINCELAEIGRQMGCQMMVEGPGHVAIDEIEANIILQKRMSNHAPYYMLGPIPTDVMAGYDHVAAAIGATYSAHYGADLICYITPAEHLALPNEQDVVEGVRVARLGAYIGRYGQISRADAAAGSGDEQGPARLRLGQADGAGLLPRHRQGDPGQPGPVGPESLHHVRRILRQ